MARRDFRTPPTLPETNITRCVTIPASQEWLGLMNAALLFLTEAWRYEQVEETDLTAAETAAKWYEIYVQYLTGECEGVGCCTELRTDPNTGALQYSNDDGLTWFDVAEGPWVDAPNVPTAAPPPPLNTGTDEGDRCLAAWNAADVIAEFYRQTAGAAAAGLYNTVLSMNMFLNELNNALLELAYPQAGRIVNAIGFNDFDWGEYAEAPTLDSTAMEALRCLLYCNSTSTAGVVSFDHGAVYDNLIADLGINPGTAVTLLVGYMGEAGLNHAGGIQSNTTAECDCPLCNDCESYTDNLTTELGFRSAFVPSSGFLNAWGGTVTSGTYNASGGRTGGGNVGGVGIGTFEGSSRVIAELLIDLGQECNVSAVSFWHKQFTNNADDTTAHIKYYDADRVELRSVTSGFLDESTTWRQLSDATGAAGCRYIRVYSGVNNPAVTTTYIDDIVITVT